MKLRQKILTMTVLAISGLLLVSMASAEGPYKLKPGAKGRLCLDCHNQFKEKLTKPFVHTPVKKGECSGCHNPHASSHGQFLGDDAGRICFSCHADIVPEKTVSTHAAVVAGECVKCHDPHSSAHKNNLLEAGSKLCFGCHQELGQRLATAKYRHKPVDQNCLTCHDAHASTTAGALLGKAVPEACTGCHNPASASFLGQHMNYPVGKARCTTCHDPHGSNSPGLLYDNFHKPVANKMCNQCHLEPNSPEPFKTKKPGFELCKGCHNSTFNDFSAKKRIHWPMFGEVGCANCHEPHASPQKGLLRKPMLTLCGECHADTIARQDKSLLKHQPIKDGECSSCHDPHASNNLHLFLQPSVNDLCGSCHDWHKHSTHPIGEKAVDPRNPNLTLDCTSCHRSHGTEYKMMMYTPTVSEMCTQCHTKYMR
jgi:predicted CXXCH cytochrome family protein